MQSVMQALGGVLNLQGHLSFGSITNTKPQHDAVSLPSISLRRRNSRFVPMCVENKASPRSILMDEMRTKFVEVFEVLKSELLNDPVFEWTDTSRRWMEQCQASAVVVDDIVDASSMRHGQPSWHTNPKVGNIAIIDGVTLLCQVPRILKKHFGEKPYYANLMNLFNEVIYQSLLGETMDTITNAEEEKDFLKYSFTLHHHIAKYKTAYYTFYLPVACALLLAGENFDDHATMKDVLLDMGVYYQILDDYNDCFGDPLKKGKIGTDIENCKCSWLVLKALELCNEEQKKILLDHYGKAYPPDVAKVKAIYNEVDIHSAFISYKDKTFDKLRSYFESHPSKSTKALSKLCDHAFMHQ